MPAALRYFRARQRAELTASRLAALVRATLNINAAETFDGLASGAAAGAAQPRRAERKAPARAARGSFEVMGSTQG